MIAKEVYGSISIHAPRAGSDADAIYPGSTLEISIHAPRAGSDLGAVFLSVKPLISIHAPRAGSDPLATDVLTPEAEFQSMLPVRGATQGNGNIVV